MTLKSARLTLNMSVIQFATALGVTRYAIYRYENGERPVPKSITLLAQAYLDGWRPNATS